MGTDECTWLLYDGDGKCGKADDIQSLTFYKNGLVGTLPSELGLLTSLRFLEIQESEETGGLQGGVPSDLSRLPMETFLLTGHNISEPLPDNLFDNWTECGSIKMHENRIPGPLPNSISKLSSVAGFHFQDN